MPSQPLRTVIVYFVFLSDEWKLHVGDFAACLIPTASYIKTLIKGLLWLLLRLHENTETTTSSASLTNTLPAAFRPVHIC